MRRKQYLSETVSSTPRLGLQTRQPAQRHQCGNGGHIPSGRLEPSKVTLTGVAALRKGWHSASLAYLDPRVTLRCKRRSLSWGGDRVSWRQSFRDRDQLVDSALYRFPADKFQPLERYIRMAATLTKKSARDVAFRVRWMSISQAERKRTADNEGTKQRQQQQFRRERGQSIFNVQPNVPLPHLPMYSHSATPVAPGFDDHGSATVGAMGGPIAQLLEQNYAVLNQFKRNMAHCKVSENTDLLARFRDNILSILAQMSAMPGVMQQMPPLPVRVNMELAQNFLPKSVGGAFPMGMPFMPPPMPGVQACDDTHLSFDRAGLVPNTVHFIHPGPTACNRCRQASKRKPLA
ncbi:hypothetical protein WJX73_001608 [Symbiochloris irregularis]|uniref:Uncharacterized protein n=1 Tax=Symbiochloris irregularis TaxID=706552 RepID=A0AAW1PA68_9CHLO